MRFNVCIWVVVGLFCVVAVPAYACCGVEPTISTNPLDTICVGQPVAMTGVITGTEVWPGEYSTGPVSLAVQLLAPSGAVSDPPVVLSNCQEFPGATPPYATWDLTCGFTPMEAGTYLYTQTVTWTSASGWQMTFTYPGTFDVVQCPGKITGGGFFYSPGGSADEDKNTFGFVAQYVDGSNLPTGNVELQIHGSMKIKGTAVAGLAVFGNTGVCHGTCSVNGVDGYSFTMTVVDNGEPGKVVDTISVSVGGMFLIPPTVIDHGNIQVHK